MIGPIAILSYLLAHPMGTNTSTTPFVLTSPKFKNHGMIPKTYTCWGKKRIPPLEWSGAPKGTQSYALLMIDEDVPRAHWYQWVIFNIPAEQTSLPENIKLSGASNKNYAFNQHVYHNPCPSHKKHHYEIVLYALDKKLPPTLQTHPIKLRKTLEKHALATTELFGHAHKPTSVRSLNHGIHDFVARSHDRHASLHPLPFQ